MSRNFSCLLVHFVVKKNPRYRFTDVLHLINYVFPGNSLDSCFSGKKRYIILLPPGWWNGRHWRLKISCPKGRTGSNPVPGTTCKSKTCDFLAGLFLCLLLIFGVPDCSPLIFNVATNNKITFFLGKSSITFPVFGLKSDWLLLSCSYFLIQQKISKVLWCEHGSCRIGVGSQESLGYFCLCIWINFDFPSAQ